MWRRRDGPLHRTPFRREQLDGLGGLLAYGHGSALICDIALQASVGRAVHGSIYRRGLPIPSRTARRVRKKSPARVFTPTKTANTIALPPGDQTGQRRLPGPNVNRVATPRLQLRKGRLHSIALRGRMPHFDMPAASASCHARF